ncbi:hypothetical protein MP638_005600 [Amoeboaphelidium occidentale]|nr:hypothetical protein MP638_005600 [Amoeboaphelidium occidentale]
MPIVIDGQKYACEACVRGHRTSSCTHKDRTLVKILPKGRPRTSCQSCRIKKGSGGKCYCEADSRFANNGPGGKMRGYVEDPQKDVRRCSCSLTGICTCCSGKKGQQEVKQTVLLNDRTLPSAYAHMLNWEVDMFDHSSSVQSLGGDFDITAYLKDNPTSSPDDITAAAFNAYKGYPSPPTSGRAQARAAEEAKSQHIHNGCHSANSCTVFRKLLPKPVSTVDSLIPGLYEKYSDHLRVHHQGSTKCERFEALLFAVEQALEKRDTEETVCCPHDLALKIVSADESVDSK